MVGVRLDQVDHEAEVRALDLAHFGIGHFGPAESGVGEVRELVNSVTAKHSKPAYGQALDAFERWCAESGGPGGRPGFTKATVQAYRTALESTALAAASINVRLSAVKKLAAEAADNGLLAPEVAAAIARVKGAKRHGVRAGNWLTLDQTERLLALPDHSTRELFWCTNCCTMLASLMTLSSLPDTVSP